MTNYKEIQKSILIAKVLEASFDDALKLCLENAALLDDVCFIFSHPNGINYMNKFQECVAEGIDIVNFFTSDSLYCINQKFLIGMLINDDNCRLQIETLVSLDTQIISYMYRYHNNKTCGLPTNIQAIVNFIANSHFLIDGLAYTMENALFDPLYLDSQVFKDNTLAFETFFDKNLRNAKINSQKIIDHTKLIFKDDFSNWYRRQYKLYYLELLVMTNLQINYKNKSTYDKEKLYIEYFHNVIGILCDREVNLAKLFFMYGTNIRFFGKIQKGRKDIIKSLKNMAWDIFHLQNTLSNTLFQTGDIVDFTIPFFITYDQRLKDIIPIYKIKSLAFIKNSFNKHLNHITDLVDPLLKQKYMTAPAVYDRQTRVQNSTETELIKRIDVEIEKFENLL